MNFLDITISNINSNIKFDIYRKPTTTSTTIHASSYHSHTHKIAAYNSLIYRATKIPLEKDKYTQEINTIKYIAISNRYNTNMIDKLIKKRFKKDKYKHLDITKEGIKYISMNYTNILPEYMLNIIKKIGFQVSFRTSNNIGKKLLHHNKIYLTKEKSGIYKMQCKDCDKIYIGQTGRTFYKRYTEHLPKSDIRKVDSIFAKHLMNENHDPQSFEDSCIPLHICHKGSIMNATEEFEIYKAIKKNLQKVLNEKLKFKNNSLYDTVLDTYNSDII